MTIFETERLLVRQYELHDGENFFLLNGDQEIMRYIRAAKSKEECAAFLREIIEGYESSPLYGRWAAIDKAEGEFVGSFAIIPFEGSDKMQLGYVLLARHWGKGYATELTRKGIEYVFTKTPLETIYAYAEKPNTSSHKVLLKSGFSYSQTLDEAGKQLMEFVLSKKHSEPGQENFQVDLHDQSH